MFLADMIVGIRSKMQCGEKHLKWIRISRI